MLFNVWIVCIMLIVGGFVLLWIDRLDLSQRYHDATRFPLPMYLGIGLAQCVSMIPGVSRAGATIVAALLFGADRRAAARVLVLSRDADDGRRVHLRPLQELASDSAAATRS